MKTIAILGYPGSGKTWLIVELMKHLELPYPNGVTNKIGLVEYHQAGSVVFVGRYDGSKFQGTDRLSMAVAPHFVTFYEEQKQIWDEVKMPEEKRLIIAEGDRINCMPFFKAAQAHGELIRIKLDTDTLTLRQRREQRNHQFPLSFLKTVATKVDKHSFDHVMNSEELLAYLKQNV